MVTAPVFASSSVGIAQATAAGQDNSTVTVTCPTGTTTNDLLIFLAANDAANVYDTWSASLAPIYCSNGTDFPTPTDGHQGDIGSGSWYRFATSADVAGSTTYSVHKYSNPTAMTLQPNLLFCLRYTGVDPALFPGTAPTINNTNKTAIGPKRAYKMGPNTLSTTSPAPVNPTSILTTDTVIRAYIFGSDTTNSGVTMGATPAGFTKRGGTTAQTATASKFNVGMVVCDITGTTSPGVATTTCNVTGMWDMYTFALPAAPDITAGFMPFFRTPGHHENELEQRPSGLYVQRRRIAGVRPDGGRDRVLVRS
jgi:hypothetical protein